MSLVELFVIIMVAGVVAYIGIKWFGFSDEEFARAMRGRKSD